MKDELRSAVAGGYGGTRANRRQKYGGADLPAVLSVVAAAAKVGKSGKARFSARLIFLPSFRWLSHRVAVSRSDFGKVWGNGEG